MTRTFMSIGCLLVWSSTSGCGDGPGPTGPSTDANPDGGLPWDQGGEDIPEYSLGRLLIADAEQVAVFDLDSELVAGTLPLQASALFEGGSGRYNYVVDVKAMALRVVDPGQWLLSHIDHFHIAKSELGVRAEQLPMLELSSITTHEGWIVAVDGQAGTVTSFQERSVTAMRFTPTPMSIEPHRGVALVSHAHALMSDSSSGSWGISVRDLLHPDALKQHVPDCSEPQGIAATETRVLVTCKEGLLALDWQGDTATFASSALEPSPEGKRPLRVRGHLAQELFVVEHGPRELAALTQAGRAEVRFEADILDFHVRRQGTAVVVLTNDGRLREVSLAPFEPAQTLDLLPAYAGDISRAPRFVLSHAYAYVADPRLAEVVAVRLATWEVEARFALGFAPLDIAMAGMPPNYTDERE